MRTLKGDTLRFEFVFFITRLLCLQNFKTLFSLCGLPLVSVMCRENIHNPPRRGTEIPKAGTDLRGGCRGCAPSPEITCGFLIQLVFCKKKTMWLIGVEVEQETSAPPPKKILNPPLEGRGGCQNEAISEGVRGCLHIYRGLFPGGLSKIGELIMNITASLLKKLSVILLSLVFQSKHYC